MPQINLLPWREELREEKKRRFLIALGASALTCILVILLIHLYLHGQVLKQQSANDLLKTEIAVLDKKIAQIKDIKKERSMLLARMQIIQELQANRLFVVHLFDELVRILPSGVFLNEIVFNGQSVFVTGEAQSNARVSEFMRNIEISDWLKNPTLKQISRDKQTSSKETNLSDNLFTVEFSLNMPTSLEEDDDGDWSTPTKKPMPEKKS